MKALCIDSKNEIVKEIDIEMQANTVYSFFNSILIDELQTIHKHTVYTDANALSKQERAYFLAGQLVMGDALIIGQDSFLDIDVSIPENELKTLINYDLNPFYKDALELISKSDVNLYRTFEVLQNDEIIQLNVEWVLYTFNIADEKTKDYFLTELKKSLALNDNTEEFMKNMAQRVINSTS